MRWLVISLLLINMSWASLYTDTYNKAWRLASENYTLSQTMYRQLMNNKKIQSDKKARICLNMGNDSIRYNDVDTAIQQYTQGLKYEPKNERLKHNLELAKKIQKEKKQNKQQDKQQDKQDNKNQQQQNQQEQKKKQAEQQLNAFKDQEIKDLQQNMQQRSKKYNVEKDW